MRECLTQRRRGAEKVNKSQFQYSWRKKNYHARTSTFVEEMP